jgi:hypothetical protein
MLDALMLLMQSRTNQRGNYSKNVIKHNINRSMNTANTQQMEFLARKRIGTAKVDFFFFFTFMIYPKMTRHETQTENECN